MIHPHINDDFASLRAVIPDASIQDLPDGTAWVTVPSVRLLPSGAWNADTTSVSFIAPAGYPQARPDCFFADAGLRLASGALPKNSNIQAAPNVPGQYLWFSWHVNQWDPNKDNFITYLNVIKKRLRTPE
jgi:hypothetical protein